MWPCRYLIFILKAAFLNIIHIPSYPTIWSAQPNSHHVFLLLTIQGDRGLVLVLQKWTSPLLLRRCTHCLRCLGQSFLVFLWFCIYLLVIRHILLWYDCFPDMIAALTSQAGWMTCRTFPWPLSERPHPSMWHSSLSFQCLGVWLVHVHSGWQMVNKGFSEQIQKYLAGHWDIIKI